MNTQKKAMLALAVAAFSSSIYSATQNLLAYITMDYPTIDPLTVVTLMSVPSIASLIVSLVNGPIAMKVSSKLLMLIYTIFSSVSLLGFALVGAKGPFTLLMVSAIVQGIGSGGRSPLQNTLVSELIEPGKQASFIAFSSALANGGMALSNYVFGAVGSGNGGKDWPKAFYFAAALSILTLVAVAILLPNDKAKQEKSASNEKKKISLNGWKPYRVLGMMLMIGIFMVVLSAFTLNMSNYIIVEYQLGTSADAGVVSMVMTITGMLVGFTYSVWEKVLKRWTATAGFVVAMAGLFSMMILTNSLLGIYLCAFCIGIGLNLITPFGVSNIMAACPQYIISLAMSVFTGVNFLGVFAAPYILNGVGNILGGGIQGMLITGVIACAIGGAVSVILFGRSRKGAE